MILHCPGSPCMLLATNAPIDSLLEHLLGFATHQKFQLSGAKVPLVTLLPMDPSTFLDSVWIHRDYYM